MPFLRLTRDRRGIENTFLLHADHAGGRPRVLYWYRTAPGISVGRAPLDEEAIHTIEENHPHIDFDWPAILALCEAMTPEDEAPPVRPKRKPRRERDEAPEAATSSEKLAAESISASVDSMAAPAAEIEETRVTPGLLEELVGREIAARLRARYADICTLIRERESDSAARESRLQSAEPLNPDGWTTPEAALDGVRGADALYERVRAQLLGT
ncbi:MAG: hypothetical protein ACRD2N_20470 [Vicinamibacterales bacterium]